VPGRKRRNDDVESNRRARYPFDGSVLTRGRGSVSSAGFTRRA
jgi:hypothetical protein